MLLDTHTLVWAMRMPEKLSSTVRAILDEAQTRAISAASLYEIALKGRLGKWPEVADIWHTDMASGLYDMGIEIIPLCGGIMQRAGGMDWFHRDPFDRMIVATALEKKQSLLSKDKTLDTCGNKDLHRIW